MAISIQDLLPFRIFLTDKYGRILRQVGIGYPYPDGNGARWSMSEDFDPNMKYKFDVIYEEARA